MIEIVPVRKLDSSITVPGSKYVANRVLFAAALADGVSVIKNSPDNEDINNLVKALRQFGVSIKKEGGDLKVKGSRGKLQVPSDEIDVGHSGTLLRFITGLSALAKGKVNITGSRRIQERPIKDLLEALNVLGVGAKSLNQGYPPVEVHGGSFKGGTVRIKGGVSSQYISSLLLIAPYAEKDVEIVVQSHLVSKKYVDMTIDLMKEFGVEVDRVGYKRFLVKSGQRYCHREFTIPGDWSSAGYFMAAAAIVPGKVRIKNLDMGSRQGEAKFCDVLAEFGCKVEKGHDYIRIEGTRNLRPVDVDVGSMPDVAQTLAAVACFCRGVTRIRNIENLRYKESNRVEDTAAELKKIGVGVETSKNAMIIKPGKLCSAVIETHEDHRMAMSLALIGLRVPGIRIKTCNVVDKSFPGYWEKLKEIGAGIKDVE